MHRQPNMLANRTVRAFSTRGPTILSPGLAIIPTAINHVVHQSQYASPSRQQSPARSFHSSRDFADYMKQVMSPMTGREGEQTPSEESNTLREIDRLFTIISRESSFFLQYHSKVKFISKRVTNPFTFGYLRKCLPGELDYTSSRYAGAKVRPMVERQRPGRQRKRGGDNLKISNQATAIRSGHEDDGRQLYYGCSSLLKG
jgi:hypothetical protein